MPLVSQTFDQLLDFTRTTSGTFVGSNGLIQNTPASVNLLTYTQQFDNAFWVKGGATVTANATVAPDGTSTADKLVGTAAAGYHGALAFASMTSGVSYALTFYVKAAEYSKFYIADGSNGSYNCAYDLAAGTAGTPGGAYTGKSASITNVGNGWYRCELNFTATATETSAPVVGGYPTGATLNNFGVQYTGDGTSGIFVWGAQLEVGSTATTYTRNNGGRFPPRFDYDPVTLAPKGLLVEEQRTNLLLYSAQFDNSNWAPTGATISANTTASPDGTVNADSLVEDTSLAVHRVFQAVACSASTTYTYTAYVKAAGRTEVRLVETTLGGAFFNLSTITVTATDAGVTASIQDAGNGWRRCRITATTGVAQILFVAQIQGSDASGSVYTGNGTTALFLYGAQLEAGAFATSYIPTVASQVTRAADQCAIVAPNFAPWYNASEGTFVFEGDSSSLIGYPYAVLASDGTFSNRFGIYRALNLISGLITSSGVTQLDISASPVVANVPFKVALAARTNSGNLSFNGGIGTDDTSITMPTVNRLSLASGPSGVSDQINGHIRSIRYYPTRLTNAQLQALTA